MIPLQFQNKVLLYDLHCRNVPLQVGLHFVALKELTKPPQIEKCTPIKNMNH